MGVVHLSVGDLEAAQQWCERAVLLSRALPSEATFAAAIDTLACVLASQARQAREAGDADQALGLERRAADASRRGLEAARRARHRGFECSTLVNLANSLTLIGQPQEALALLDEMASDRSSPLAFHRAHHLATRAMVLHTLGRQHEAVQAYEAALALSDDEPLRAGILEELSAVLEAAGRWQEALAHYKQLHQIQLSLSAERARRSARLAALRLDVERERARARRLASTNAELQRRSDDLSRQALEDPLTGLPNRRRIDAWRRDTERQAAVLMIDVDHFKQINDRHLHEVGDTVLRTLAKVFA